ncbi:Putative uncharacterized protein [Taphrina deformans PYCC 5710]|uniref:Uncharacterized protein n=1 Tax=Taphrina deformans (strain PYCC 5710 / ATCC 11124 / CBS 356.35 / IMI 108563 / JCM 9778 / NBRC 8474) TaxID=1097556 RepID=R4X6Y0_TAPDE|nr:Putative uncharacterized protein [Taphrina deformans PYCC 5710]|eukprot:CCG80987.1 Putative uncharacterized protein [Taphrina deformans PYCC 5710]
MAFNQFIGDLITKNDATSSDENTKLKILIDCMHKAKQVQVIGDVDNRVLNQLNLPHDFFDFVLSHGVPAIRAAGLQLLVSHPRLTTTFESNTFEILKNNLSCQFYETDMQLRKEILSGFRAFFARFQASIYACMALLKKEKAGTDSKTLEIKAYLKTSELFAAELVRLLKSNLEPGNGYQVTYTSLQLLQLASAFGWCTGPSVICDKYASFKTPKSNTQEKPLPFVTGMFDEEMVLLLLNCLGDSFDDNRTLALALLVSPSVTLTGLQQEEQISQACQNAKRLLYSTRGRDGDGGARMLQLIFQRFILRGRQLDSCSDSLELVDTDHRVVEYLETFLDDVDKDTKNASKDMLISARSRPLHGRLIALRYMIESLEYQSEHGQQKIDHWSKLYSRIIKSCKHIWETIKEVLTDDSPEGKLPASVDLLQNDFLRGQDAQVILSFCWRALRETSNLLTMVLVKTPYGTGREYISANDYRIAGELSLSWLTEVRHRGAFSAVFPNVVAISKRFLMLGHSPLLATLPSIWLEKNIAELSQLSHRKDITRRSGGLPMSIISLMISDIENLSDSTSMVDLAMSRLLTLVESPIRLEDDTIELPQVHGLNTLKDIFLESKLAASSIDYVERCYIISIDGFSSPIWAIRNCCLMLFSALIRRSFGSRTSRSESLATTFTANIFFSRYPLLLNRLTKELQAAVDGLFAKSGATVTTGLHPCLCLLSRLDLVDTSEMEDYSSYEELLRLVSYIATSPVWQVRAIAAQAIPTLVERELVGSFIVQQLNQATTSDQNALHGRLLIIYYLLQYNLEHYNRDILFVEQILSDLRRAITNKFVELSSENPCATTEALWLRILMFLARTVHSEQNASLRQRVVDYCARELANSSSKQRNVVGITERNSVMTAITMRALADPKFKRFQSSSSSDAMVHLIEDERVEIRMQVYLTLHTTFGSSSILKSPTLQVALHKQSVAESWPVARNAVRLCIGNLPRSLNEHEQLVAPEIFHTYMEELRSLRNGTPTSDVTLQLIGRFIGQNKTRELISSFALLLRKFTAENQSTNTRAAALQALRYSELLKIATSNATEIEKMLIDFLPIYLDLLVDDDEDIRVETSGAVCSEILGLPAQTPERTREALLLRMARDHSGSQLLQDVIAVEITRNERPVRALSVATHPSSQLFATEKQNLWRNSVTNCRQALRALASMAVTQETMVTLSEWCVAALVGILHEIQTIEQDGPLGWTSLPDTWQIIRRTLLLKDWLLSRYEEGAVEAQTIKELLRRIARNSEGKSLHPTLLNGLKSV